MKEIVLFFYKALNIFLSEINLIVVESLISINAFVTIIFLHTFYHFTRITSWKWRGTDIITFWTKSNIFEKTFANTSSF